MDTIIRAVPFLLMVAFLHTLENYVLAVNILTFLGLCSLSFVAVEGGIAYLILIREGQYPNAYLHACFKHVSQLT